MFKNYLKIALRHLVKQRLHSFINILGLAIGIAAGIMIFLYARHELTYDAFHKKGDNIYMVYKERPTPTGTQLTYDTWLPMAKSLKETYPIIENATYVWDSRQWVTINNNRFEEPVTYAEHSLLEVFSFPLISGSLHDYAGDPTAALVTRTAAEKYFGSADPIGKTINIGFNRDYIVRGVLQDIPENSSIQIEIMVNPQSLEWYNDASGNWGGSWLSTFVQLRDGSAPQGLESQFPAFIKKTWPNEPPNTLNLKLLLYSDLYHQLTGARDYAYILLMVAFVILLIAAINFMNLTTARSVERAREIGVRKVLGAVRSQLVKQFLSESILMSLVALLLALGLVESILPFFNSLYELNLQMNYGADWLLLTGIALSGLLVGLLAGLYPAVYISKFRPNESIRGDWKSNAAGLRLRRVLVISQFVLSVVLIICSVVMWQQISFMKNANLNFDKENVVAIVTDIFDFADREQGRSQLETYRNELRRNSDVRQVSASSHIPGRWPGAFTFVYPFDRDESQRLRIRRAAIDEHFLKTYNIALAEGRDFNAEMATENTSLIVNEAALNEIGWDSGVGKQVRSGGRDFTIVGVIKNFHFQSLAEPVAPIVIAYQPAGSRAHRVISVKISGNNTAETMAFLEAKWKELVPGNPFNAFFVDENFDQLYQDEGRLATVASAFTILAIIIACLGLFALSSLMITQRTKEIGVRKVLGASLANIVMMLTGEYLKLVLVAFALACPIAWILSQRLLADFPYQVGVGLSVFLIVGVFTVLITCLTVGFQSLRAAAARPIESLKYE